MAVFYQQRFSNSPTPVPALERPFDRLRRAVPLHSVAGTDPTGNDFPVLGKELWVKKRDNDKAKKLALHRETVKVLDDQILTAVAGGWSSWSVTWAGGGGTCVT
jgi:hypothetical protein